MHDGAQVMIGAFTDDPAAKMRPGRLSLNVLIEF